MKLHEMFLENVLLDGKSEIEVLARFEKWLKEFELIDFKAEEIMLMEDGAEPPISFMDFLENRDLKDEYLELVKIKNQRWIEIGDYTELNDLKKQDPEYWILNAFLFDGRKNNWMVINNDWVALIEDERVIWE